MSKAFTYYFLIVLPTVMMLLAISTFNISLAFDNELTSQISNKVRLGQLIKDTHLLKQPRYQSDPLVLVKAEENINIKYRQSAWYFISTMNSQTPETFSGWVSMLSVRFDSTPKREGDLGVQSLFSSVTHDSLPTVSTGIRGFDEGDLKNAKADLSQLILLKSYTVSSNTAVAFAHSAKLASNKTKVKEDK
ncbi:hypothetical protein CXF85_14850 [Colwellia sp. 75C3]|uniref:hypothetical protein n=1 Tax=Colwellia sp. 75C3 TaxID=888425 RepID=UPI000C31D145|nr:hypothetical protein [Colwellia sp. 75C3]PKG82172.1 hypothetical protein CXF85_14850 [Colwellia sp. 75C3]